MSVLSEKSSFLCEAWHDANGRACDPDTPGAKLCGAFLNVDYNRPFCKELKGKLKRRECTRCKSWAEYLDHRVSKYNVCNIDIAKPTNERRLFDLDD